MFHVPFSASEHLHLHRERHTYVAVLRLISTTTNNSNYQSMTLSLPIFSSNVFRLPSLRSSTHCRFSLGFIPLSKSTGELRLRPKFVQPDVVATVRDFTAISHNSVWISDLLTCFIALWREQISRWHCNLLKIFGKCRRFTENTCQSNQSQEHRSLNYPTGSMHPSSW